MESVGQANKIRKNLRSCVIDPSQCARFRPAAHVGRWRVSDPGKERAGGEARRPDGSRGEARGPGGLTGRSRKASWFTGRSARAGWVHEVKREGRMGSRGEARGPDGFTRRSARAGWVHGAKPGGRGGRRASLFGVICGGGWVGGLGFGARWGGRSGLFGFCPCGRGLSGRLFPGLCGRWGASEGLAFGGGVDSGDGDVAAGGVDFQFEGCLLVRRGGAVGHREVAFG
jgi:hypothetical protein